MAKFNNGDKIFDKEFKEEFVFSERTDGFAVNEDPERFVLVSGDEHGN